MSYKNEATLYADFKKNIQNVFIRKLFKAILLSEKNRTFYLSEFCV